MQRIYLSMSGPDRKKCFSSFIEHSPLENFTFFNPTRIEFGTGKEQLIGQHLAEHGIKEIDVPAIVENVQRNVRIFGIAETYTPEVVTAILKNAL